MAAQYEGDKSRRGRSKAPRVRTGCITCKARRLKCDETKPTCLRCQQDRHTCEGYKITPRLKPGPKPRPKARPDSQANVLLLQRICKDSGLRPVLLPRRQRNHVPLPTSAAWQTTIPNVVPERLFTNDNDSALFRHAQFFVLNYVASVYDPTDFWHCYAMPLAHGATPLKYAICALGAAHRHFLLSGPGDLDVSKDAVLRSEIAAIEKYNAAIAQIQAYAGRDHQGIYASVPIICCVIFICIEQLLGRYRESVRHLQAGCCLLGSSSDPAAAAAPADLRNAVLRLFYHLGHDTVAFNGDNVLGGLPAGYPMPDMGSRHEPFASYDEASKMLQLVDIVYNVTFVSHGNATNSHQVQEEAALSSSREAFDVWNSRFELLRQSGALEPEQPSQDHQPDQLIFSLEQNIWAMLTAMANFNEDVNDERCKTILSQAEAVVQMYQSQKQPTFALGGDIIPVLAFICASCEDRETQLRSVAVLRSLRRREGIWDSREVADECETMILTCPAPQDRNR